MLDPWRPGWFRLAAVAVVVAVVLLWYALLRRRIGAAPLAIGALVWLAVLGAVLAAVAPGGSYLVAWPALAGAVAGIVAALSGNRRGAPGRGAGRRRGRRGGAGAHRRPVLPGARPAHRRRAAASSSPCSSSPCCPRSTCCSPTRTAGAGGLASAVVPGVAVVLAVACAAVGLSVDRFDAAHPVPSQLAYALDRDTGQAWWASTESSSGRLHGAVRRPPRHAAHRPPLPGRQGDGDSATRSRRTCPRRR